MAMKSLRLAELGNLSDEQIDRRVADLSANAFDQPNGEMELLNERIAEFETRYEMPSETMRAKLSTRELDETADFCAWSMLVDLRDKLVATKA